MFILFFCWINNHCCLITVIGPEFSMLVSSGRYILKTEVIVLCFPNRVTVVHLSNPCGSSSLMMMADDIFPNTMMIVPPALYLLFQGIDESEV